MTSTETGVEITVTENRLQVILRCVVTDETRENVLDQIEEELAALGIVDPPNRADLAEILAVAAKRGDGVLETVLVQGQPVVPPTPGRIEWARDFFSTDFLVDESTGTMDYRVRKGQPAVQEGELLARIVPPIRGRAGRDVFGKTISPGEPQSLRMVAGSNVRLDRENRECHAAISGRARWFGGVLSVDPVLTIHGNVGLETGDISHPGALVVKNDIAVGAHVKTKGDIEVGGIVEEADIESGGCLVVAGGITGDAKHRIRVADGVAARFILDADLHAGGDVTARREIVHSNIVTKRRVLIPEGRVVGGSICAVGGIDAGQAGSDANVPTVLIAGVDEEAQAAIYDKEKQIEQHREEMEQIRTALPRPAVRPKTLPDEKQKMLDELTDKLNVLEETVRGLEAEIAAIRDDLKGRSNPRVTIRKVLYPETTIRLGTVQLHVRESYTGPLSAILVKGEVALSALTIV